MFITKHKNSIIILSYKGVKVNRKNFLLKNLTNKNGYVSFLTAYPFYHTVFLIKSAFILYKFYYSQRQSRG